MAVHIVNTHEAKSRLSQLIREVEDGGDVVLARNGRPVAKIIPWPPVTPARIPGRWAGRVEYISDPVPADPDVLAVFDESATGDMP